MDDRVRQFLPCRVTITELNGKVYVSAIKPKKLASLFKSENLRPVCAEIHDMYESLVSEATFQTI